MRCRSLHSLCANYQAIIFNQYHTVPMLTLWPRRQLHKKSLIPRAQYQLWINNLLWPQESLMPGLAATAATSCLVVIWDTFLELNPKQCSSLSEGACPELAWFFYIFQDWCFGINTIPFNKCCSYQNAVNHPCNDRAAPFLLCHRFIFLNYFFLCMCTQFLIQNLGGLCCWKS